jgi:hypothetical protein
MIIMYQLLTQCYSEELFFSFLGSTAQLRPWPPPQNLAEFREGFSTNTEELLYMTYVQMMKVPVCPHVFCVAQSSVGRGLVMGQTPVQGVLPKCIKGFIVSKITFDF